MQRNDTVSAQPKPFRPVCPTKAKGSRSGHVGIKVPAWSVGTSPGLASQRSRHVSLNDLDGQPSLGTTLTRLVFGWEILWPHQSQRSAEGGRAPPRRGSTAEEKNVRAGGGGDGRADPWVGARVGRAGRLKRSRALDWGDKFRQSDCGEPTGWRLLS